MAGDHFKIMQGGNRITAHAHYKFPALKKRPGYGKALYEIRINVEYIIDFVGSQKHGIRPEDDKNWYDRNCEA